MIHNTSSRQEAPKKTNNNNNTNKITFLSSDKGANGCFLAAAAAVGDIELKWRRFLSASPVLPISTKERTQLKNPRIYKFLQLNYH